MSAIQEKKAQIAQKLAEIKVLQKEVDDLIREASIARAVHLASIEHDMRTATDENIKRLRKLKRIGWEEAWKELRCLELEDGDSICCTEECSVREDEADEELVEAARRGKQKRNARRAGAGRPVSDDDATEAEASEAEAPEAEATEAEATEDETSEGEDSVKPPYIAPPKVRDAELNWPFMRCKNVARALQGVWANKPIPRNHHALLEHIANVAKVSVETLKKTSARELFKDNYRVMQVLGKSSRW